jgi:hypothetical protein
VICGSDNGAAAVKTAVAGKATVKRRRSYASEKGVSVIAVREERDPLAEFRPEELAEAGKNSVSADLP